MHGIAFRFHMFRAAPIKTLRRSDWAIASVIFVAALALRLLFLFAQGDRDWPHSAFYEGDAIEWARWAVALHKIQPYEFDLPMRSPGVAYLLCWLGGGDSAITSFAGFKALWCVMSAAKSALAYLGIVLMFPR